MPTPVSLMGLLSAIMGRPVVAPGTGAERYEPRR
jgi:hypothetical protein